MSYTRSCLFKTEIWNPPVFYFFMLCKVNVGGVNSFGLRLTSEIDNVCKIQEKKLFSSFGKAYVCKLADIEKKEYYSQMMTA